MSKLIVCPKCTHEFDATDQFRAEVEKQLKDEFNQKFLKIKSELDLEKKALEKKEDDLERIATERANAQVKVLIEAQERQSKEQMLQMKEQSSQQMAQMRAILEEDKKRFQKQMEDEIKLREQALLKKIEEAEAKELQLKEASEKVKTLEFEMKNQALEMERNFQLQAQEKLNAEMQTIKERFERDINEQIERERKKQAEEIEKIRSQAEEQRLQLQKQLEAANQRLNQGSMQVQGEAFEKLVQSLLEEHFRNKKIQGYYCEFSPVKTGQEGADLHLIIKDTKDRVTGTILIEIKQTANFQKIWIDKMNKLRDTHNADGLLIISEAMPKGASIDFTQEDNVWITKKSHCTLLIDQMVQHIIQVVSLQRKLSNADDKKLELYTYFTSPEFRSRMVRIFNFYKQRLSYIDAEQEFFKKKWNKERKDINDMLEVTGEVNDSILRITEGEEEFDIAIDGDKHLDISYEEEKPTDDEQKALGEGQ